jgi:hypothetical protein
MKNILRDEVALPKDCGTLGPRATLLSDVVQLLIKDLSWALVNTNEKTPDNPELLPYPLGRGPPPDLEPVVFLCLHNISLPS